MGNPSWVPPSGLVDWLKADDSTKIVTSATDGGTADGSPTDGHYVKTWADSNGGSIVWGPNAGNSPLYVTSGINGLPCVQFLGTPTFLDTSGVSALSLTDAEIFFVIKNGLDDTNLLGMSIFGSAGAGNGEWYSYAGTIYESFGSTGRPGVVANPVALDSPHVYSVLADSSGNYAMSFDGTAAFFTTGNTVGWQSTSTIGKNFDGAAYVGLIGEMLLFDHTLSSGDRDSVYAYLRDKWGTP